LYSVKLVRNFNDVFVIQLIILIISDD